MKSDPNGSPFVLIFDNVGIPGAAHIINFVVITAALSAFNSGLFGSGRMLYNLSLQNNGPKFLKPLARMVVQDGASYFLHSFY